MRKLIILIISFVFFNSVSAQINKEKESDYIEFDDRKNIVHGVYIGLNQYIGEISNEIAGLTSLKIAYVANKKLEVGFGITTFYSKQPNNTSVYNGNEILLLGGYGGIHLEPILFGNKAISMSFPLLIGGGSLLIVEKKIGGGEFDNLPLVDNNSDSFFIIEPGINLLYNISRFFQLETGIRYRFSESFSLPYYGKDNIKGFSAGIGIKLGVFNLKRQKKIKDNFQ